MHGGDAHLPGEFVQLVAEEFGDTRIGPEDAIGARIDH